MPKKQKRSKAKPAGAGEDIQATVISGMQDLVNTVRSQIAGIKAFAAGLEHPKDVKNVLTSSHSKVLLNYARLLQTAADEERKQIAAASELFAGMSDQDVATLAKQAAEFLRKEEEAGR